MIHIVWNEAASLYAANEGRSSYPAYFFEMINYLGLSYRKWNQEQWIECRPPGLTVVIGAKDASAWQEACASYCRDGNNLLLIGGTYGLQEVLGVRSKGILNEGWVEWEKDTPADGLRSSFHFFHGECLELLDDESESWGRFASFEGVLPADATFPAAIFRRIGLGCAALIAIDLMKTSCIIQQGIQVIRDGCPAPDGTARIDDGILKTDDGSVLDWVRDRSIAAQGQVPFHMFPIVDEWRIVLMRIMYRLANERSLVFGQVWFWPRGLAGIGHISHDSDRNSAEHALLTLELLSEAEIRSTWCVIMPGYTEDVNARIVKDNHEVALHYNALGTEIPQSRWQETDFQIQLDMLKKQFPDKEIVSNKNHYLRWEGDVQFYHWCDRAGIRVEQSKGGTKEGNKGFLAGTCHPFRPQSMAMENDRVINVLNVPTLAWDPPEPSRCTEEEMYALVDRCYEVNGVAHFLFHPNRVGQRDNHVGVTMMELIRYVRGKRMEWWTSEDIWRWCDTRRRIQMEVTGKSDGKYEIIVVSEVPVKEVSLLLAINLQESMSVTRDNGLQAISLNSVERFGCRYAELIADLRAGENHFVIQRERGAAS